MTKKTFGMRVVTYNHVGGCDSFQGHNVLLWLAIFVRLALAYACL